LSFLFVPDAHFAKFGTKKVNDTTFSIQSIGTTDDRFTYGLTLGLAPRPLDFRDTKVPFALWLPELTVNPGTDVKAVAIGIGASIGFVKFGWGAAYTKHTVLDGLDPSATLKSADDLATRDTYGKPRQYFSVSLIGVAPFVP